MRTAAVMCLSRLGSLNALEQSRPSRFWQDWLGAPVPSADTMGRVCAVVEPAGLRALAQQVYARLKRTKALPELAPGVMLAVVDAHEAHASYHRHCPGCLTRTIHTEEGDCLQYYHQYVAVQLVGKDFSLTLDVEPVRPGEDEVAAAQVCQPAFFHWALDHDKHALAVLKNERRDLLQDAQRLFAEQPPASIREGTVRRECWDLEGFTTWPRVRVPVRVVRSRETRSVRRQLTGRIEELVAEWTWVTTLPAAQAATGAVVQLGHARWDIENDGFNELANPCQANHVYKHEPTALLVFWLLAVICHNVFVSFYRRNLKPALRQAVSMLHVARQVTAELYARLPTAPSRAPPYGFCPASAAPRRPSERAHAARPPLRAHPALSLHAPLRTHPTSPKSLPDHALRSILRNRCGLGSHQSQGGLLHV